MAVNIVSIQILPLRKNGNYNPNYYKMVTGGFLGSTTSFDLRIFRFCYF